MDMDVDSPQPPTSNQSSFEDDLMLKRAWKILLPGCVNELVREDSFGLGPTQHCTPDKFYDILFLWWNQQLQLADINQLQPNHLNILQNYLHKNNQEEKTNTISDYLGFYQPKNGICGLVAGLHAIKLSIMWDQVINESMEQMASKPIDPTFDFKHLMIETITHALITSANTAMNSFEYDPNINKNTEQNNKPTTWNCKHCQTQNPSANVFCKSCYKEPEPKSESEPKNETTNTNKKDRITIDACSKIYIITDGEIPIRNDNNNLLFYNESLFGFNIHCINYNKNDIDGTKEIIMNYLLNNINFENNFIKRGSCLRILLSLILTHGIQRCEYELLLCEYEQIFRQFRDESLILGPYGFCSQNLVNLTMFGHCKPIIDSSQYLSYPYGFLGHDVINPGATGFFQCGYGYEYPMYPIWVILSGTHYTTLFALPTHIQKYNNQHVLDCYHSMIKWMTDNKKKDDKKNDDNKDKQEANNNNNTNNNNGPSQSQLALPAPPTEWNCKGCGHKNDKSYVICGECFMDKDVNTGSNNNNNNNSNWKCLNCGYDNDKSYLICGGCFTDKEKAIKTSNNNNNTNNTNNNNKDENKYCENEIDSVHFEVDLLCFNGLPPSGPLLAPISINIITEKENETEKKERDRVIKSNEVLSMIDNDESDETKKLKYIKGHALVQRIESKLRKNVYYYEIAISLESHFEEIQNWKSPYFMKFKDEHQWKQVKRFFDPKILPDLGKNKNYEYPSIKWRCCSCYLGDDQMKKYAGYNDITNMSCKACSKPMYEALRTLIVSYEHVPFYIRESKIDNVYQNALVKLLKKRFRSLIVGDVNSDCLPVI